MVSPDILGASNGAGFGAALGILLSFNYFGVTVSAFVCGVGAVALAWCISRASRMNGTLAMVLAGIVVGSLFSAGTSFIKLVADTEQQLPAITYWLMGSLSSAVCSHPGAHRHGAALFAALAHQPAHARRGGSAQSRRAYDAAPSCDRCVRYAHHVRLRFRERYDRVGWPCHPALCADAFRA